MSDEFVIKQETLPVRCEVCHQADFFEPLSNHCSRCYPVIERQRENLKPLQTNSPYETLKGCLFIGSICGLVYGGVGLVISFLLTVNVHDSLGLTGVVIFAFCLLVIVFSLLACVGLWVSGYFSSKRL